MDVVVKLMFLVVCSAALAFGLYHLIIMGSVMLFGNEYSLWLSIWLFLFCIAAVGKCIDVMVGES